MKPKSNAPIEALATGSAQRELRHCEPKRDQPRFVDHQRHDYLVHSTQTGLNSRCRLLSRFKHAPPSRSRSPNPRCARSNRAPPATVVADGNGLVIEVMTTGTKVWRFRYSLNGKRQPLATIGDYRMISLRVARAKAQKYAELVAQGISPVATARRDPRRRSESRALARSRRALHGDRNGGQVGRISPHHASRARQGRVARNRRPAGEGRHRVSTSSPSATGSKAAVRPKWRCIPATSSSACTSI